MAPESVLGVSTNSACNCCSAALSYIALLAPVLVQLARMTATPMLAGSADDPSGMICSELGDLAATTGEITARTEEATGVEGGGVKVV